VPASRVALVEPGVDRSPLARGSAGGTLDLLCVAAFNAGKGHEILFRALAGNRDRPWRLTCVGNTDSEPATFARVGAAVRSAGLDARVVIAGTLSGDELNARYDQSDAFVLATMKETYGMAVAEALSRGLPVISTTTGAIPSLVGDDAGLLAAPGDAAGFSSVLTRFLADSALRDRLRAGAARARDRLNTWETSVERMARVLEQIANG
jgi:glycosyltransferase involved in cell wall biosynthesis